ncbi:class III lanthionine synthetase LanKC [Nonomuraea dietziae]|uniref:class III lanthionine synthetase LanKC n=1 Tax=Nonomuraea dietziae TaxID=65515 RepID=UPI003421EC72
MDNRYELYCLVDPLFYDSPVIDGAADFVHASRPAPTGWARTEQGEVVALRPVEAGLPEQGWKIQVSARPGDAALVMDTVWSYCVRTGLAFTFLRGEHVLHLRNAKHAGRGAGGELATLYPADETRLERALTDLGALLDGRPCPSLPGSLRIGGGPLHVRYGAFAERHCAGPDGRLEPAIADLDGRLVPEWHGPVFATPAWVRLPSFLTPHLEAGRAVALDRLPYTVEAALRLTGGGGVHLARDARTGTRVVIKEARPHAGLDADGADAVTRLEREREALTRLAGLDAVPALLAEHTVGEHRFLVLEHIQGTPLDRLGRQGRGAADHTAWALELCVKVEAAVAAVHARGLVFGDLHPGNVIVRPDGGVALVGYERCVPLEEAGGGAFAVPDGVTGADVDHHAAARLRLALFLPVTELLRIDRFKAAELADLIRESYPVPHAFLDEAVRTITGVRRAKRVPGAHIPAWYSATLPDPERWQRLRRSMTMAILSSATPERDDRLFPGDIAQFATGGLNLAHGAAGVLLALEAAGSGRFPEHERWLRERAMRPPEGARLGFYDGLHGIAHALARLGRQADSLDLVQLASRRRWESLGLDLHGGLAGIGLNLAHLADLTGESQLLLRAYDVADLVATRLSGRQPAPSAARTGLMYGSAGPALFLLRMHERTGEAGLLDLAEAALRQDLGRRAAQGDPSPHLATGGAGLAWVLAEYLRWRHDDDLLLAHGALDRAARAPFSFQPGLFTGRAGLLAYLARERGDDPEIETQLRGLGCHAVRYQAHLAFPGERLLRLSMDLATGTAGVLFAVAAALHDEPVTLPFMRSSAAGAQPHLTLLDQRGLGSETPC